MVTRCERRLAATSIFLNQAGRLEITNSVLTAMPTFCMSTFLLQQSVIDQIDKFRKPCLWRGADFNAKTKPKVAWTVVCSEKENGGLGVLNIKTQNEALLIKHLHKFFNKEDIPWVSLVWEKYYGSGKLPRSGRKGSFWWRDIVKLLCKFKGMARVQIGNGSTCLLWEDLWGNEILNQQFLELSSFAKNKKISFAEGCAQAQLHSLFHLPLSQQAHAQMLSLQGVLNEINMSEETDRWSYIWNPNKFSVKKTYKHLSGHEVTPPAYNWLWASSCQSKHKVFFWLLLKDRISTRELLQRKNMELQDHNCVLCNASVEETLTHLCLECPFAIQCWGLINVQPVQRGFRICIVSKINWECLHGDYYPNGLDNLESQKWLDLSSSNHMYSVGLAKLQGRTSVASAEGQKKLLSWNWSMDCKSYLAVLRAALKLLVLVSFFCFLICFSGWLLPVACSCSF